MADIYGTTRYIDFALESAGRIIAFEIDGPGPYCPPGLSNHLTEVLCLRSQLESFLATHVREYEWLALRA